MDAGNYSIEFSSDEESSKDAMQVVLSKSEQLARPAKVIEGLSLHFAEQPCCQLHCCYRYTIQEIANSRAGMPDGEHQRHGAVVTIIRPMVLEYKRYSDPNNRDRHICRKWLCLLLGISNRKIDLAVSEVFDNDQDQWLNEEQLPDVVGR